MASRADQQQHGERIGRFEFTPSHGHGGTFRDRPENQQQRSAYVRRGQTFPGTGKGSVTSVGLSAPSSDFTVGGTPVTTAGTLALNWITAPTSADTANAIVKRDGAGSFSAGRINGNGTGDFGVVGETDSVVGVGGFANSGEGG